MSEYSQNCYISNGMNEEIGWDDVIEKDSEFTVLPEGDYKFTVTKFDRARHNGSEKLPPCNKAVLTLEITDGFQTGNIQHQLFLHKKCEGMLCAFFTAIGQRKHGEPLRPRWNEVIGATGTCHVYVDKYTNRNGGTSENNKIRKFYEPSEQPATAAPPPKQAGNAYQTPAYSYQQPQQQPQQQSYMPPQTGYAPGKF